MSTRINDPKKAKILIVDDLPTNLRLLSNLLTEQGYEVRLAPDGKLALESSQRFLPDLILLDIKMPEMDGYEVCRRFKASPATQDIPIIFLSALDEPFDKIKAFEVGGEDYITKPFQVQEVLVRLEHQLKIKKLQKQISEQNQLLASQNEQLKGEIEERKKAEEKVREALKVKSNFLANMSHELRSPLNSILGFSQILLKSFVLDEEQFKYLKIIQSNGEYLLDTIDSILDFSKMESGLMNLHLDDCNLSAFLEHLEGMFRLKAEKKGLGLNFKIDQGLPQYLRVDEKKLKIVLSNLLNNALKFTQFGQVDLEVYHQLGKDSQLTLSFEVRDTGCGIAPSEIKQVFQAFLQTASGIRSGLGTGLGLALSQQIVSLMGGEIKVKSEVDRGTNFYFTIPVELGIASEGEILGDRVVIALDAPPGSYRILIADNREESCLLLTKLLERIGFCTCVTTNQQEIQEIVASWQPHLILIEPRMSGSDGLKLIGEIATATSIPILGVTTSPGEALPNILEAGAKDIIPKPFRESFLLAKIQQYLGVNYLYQENLEPQPPLLPLTINDFQIMSQEWLQKLQEAAMAIDETRVNELITEISPTETHLILGLKNLVENFRFDILIELTKKL